MFFGAFDFLQKTNENKLIWGIIVVKSNSFVPFLEEIEDIKTKEGCNWGHGLSAALIKTPLEINWPLVHPKSHLNLEMNAENKLGFFNTYLTNLP